MVVEWLGFNHEVRDIVVMKKIVIRFSSVLSVAVLCFGFICTKRKTAFLTKLWKYLMLFQKEAVSF